MAKLRKRPHLPAAGSPPSPFFGMPVPARGRHERQEQTISAQDLSAGTLL